jgi:hypothetical protein
LLLYQHISVELICRKRRGHDSVTQLKKRYDLLPNLVETVKGYASHEKNVFANVTKAMGSGVRGGGSW